MIPDRLEQELRSVLGDAGFSRRPADLARASRDRWTRLILLDKSHARPDWSPEAVCFPDTREQVSKVLRLCHDAGIPVVPRGGGTGLCGGAVPVSGGIVIDLSGLARIGPIHELNSTVRVECGCTGARLEAELNRRGYTLGHLPGSLESSTVGGWIATRSAGAQSSRFGKIEDLVVGLDVILADGKPLRLGGPQSRGRGMPDWRQLWLGGEGTMGIVVAATLRIVPLPPVRRTAAFRFTELEAGLEAMRTVVQAGLRPSILRLHDPWETLLLDYLGAGASGDRNEGAEPPGKMLEGVLRRMIRGEIPKVPGQVARLVVRLLLGRPWAQERMPDLLPLSNVMVIAFSGDERRTRFDLSEAREALSRAAARELAAPVAEEWARHGRLVATDLLGTFGSSAYADTVEVAGMWRDIPRIYQKTRKALLRDVTVLTTFDHVRREGCACYFTAIGSLPDRTRLLALYDRCIHGALRAAMASGASLSHHHGVGLLRRDFTPEEYPGGSRLFWSLKGAVDPHGVMNPGKVHPAVVDLPAREEEDRPLQVDLPTLLAWEDRSRPPEALLPEVPEEVVDWVKLARKNGWRLVPEDGAEAGGGRKGRKDPREVVLHLERLDQVLDFDPVSETITVQAGMTLMQVENYLRERGFTLGFAPRRELDRTIGTLLSHYPPFAGSPLYGTLRRNCLGLSAVLPDGTVFRQRPAPRRSVGPDLMHLLLGTRGRLGIITAACMRIFPKPPVREMLAYGGDDPEVALAAIRTVLLRDARPEWVLLAIRSPGETSHRHRVRVVVQVGGTRAQVSADLDILRQVMDPLGFDPEPIRPENRPRPPERRMPFLEGFLPMDRLGTALGMIRENRDPTCPQAHVTHLSMQGATLRLLIRDPRHRFPEDLEALLNGEPEGAELSRILESIKENLDPFGVLPPLDPRGEAS